MLSERKMCKINPSINNTKQNTKFKKISTVDGLVRSESLNGIPVLVINTKALEILTYEAFKDMSHLLRSSHLEKIRQIIDDPESSDNDKFVAIEIIKNAIVSAEMQLPMCQDTGTAIGAGFKSKNIFIDGKKSESEAVSDGIKKAYTELNLRYSQMAPLSMYEETNTKNNLPAQINLYADDNVNEYSFLFMAKGGGSANKTSLFQETRALLNPDALTAFLKDKINALGSAACPPYYISVAIGGTSAEENLKIVKLASARYLDDLPTGGTEEGQPFRDLEMENIVKRIANETGIGAQFGGKHFCLDARVIRLSRHGASLPVGIGVSCIADRQIMAKITPEGLFIEQLETNPTQYLPNEEKNTEKSINININKPMNEVLTELSKHPIGTRINLSGDMIVARDIAHAKLSERLKNGQGLPEYFKNSPIYYAGPAKTPAGMPSGSFGPTTAGRMDSYVDDFQKNGGSMIMIAKGNRSESVINACKNNGGFYLGSIGGVAAKLAQSHIKHIEQIEFAELGMEAVWKITVENFPAFIIIDDKGNNFYS